MFLVFITIITLLQFFSVISQAILTSASHTEFGQCSCSDYKNELIKAEKDMDDLKAECTKEYYEFSQSLVGEPKLWTKSNFCTKKSLKTVSTRLRYLLDLTRKIKDYCKAYEKHPATRTSDSASRTSYTATNTSDSASRTSDQVTQCPNNWMKNDNSCYFFPDQKKDWFQAWDYCEDLGSHLAIAETESKNNFLRRTVQSIHGQKKNGISYFIGGSDIDEESKWVWRKTRQPFSYTNWCPGEPNNAYGKGGRQNCLTLFGYCEFKWDDGRCKSKRNFICEK